jgi:hypothetical protein
MLSGSVDFPVTVDEVATALEHAPILVQNTMGSGDAAAAARRLAAIARTLPYPAYVALVSTPRDDDAGDASAYLATALSRRLATPGLYVVETSGHSPRLLLVGQKTQSVEFELQYYGNAAAVEKATGALTLAPQVGAEVALRTALHPLSTTLDEHTPPSLSQQEISDLAALQRRLDPPRQEAADDAEDEGSTWTTGKRWMLGTTVGMALFLLVQRSLRGWPGWRRSTPQRPRTKHTRAAGPDPAAQDRKARAEASATVMRLADRLATAPALLPGDDRALAALTAREVADPLLASAELADVVGALVLARTGLADLDLATRKRRARAYRCCYFHPLHGAAKATAAWRYGEADIEVPVCDACRQALVDGRPPEVFRVGRWRQRPYYERDDVWARTGYGSLVDDFAHQVALARRPR